MQGYVEDEIDGIVIRFEPLPRLTTEAENKDGESGSEHTESSLDSTPTSISDGAVNEAVKMIHKLAGKIGDSFSSAAATNKPDSVTIEFALGYQQDVNGWIVGVKTDVGLKVTLKWDGSTK